MATIVQSSALDPDYSFGVLEHRVVRRNLAWSDYLELISATNHRSTRYAYYRGAIEIMSPLPLHEWYKKLIANMLQVLLEELNIPVRSAGSTTWNREDLEAIRN